MKPKKFFYKFIISLLVAFSFSFGAFAQQAATGVLKSPTGEPLAGATVTVKGTQRSVVTDAKGGFSIEAAPGSTLVISTVGYKPKEITAGTEPINETLEIAENSLNEVVVIGYQSVKRKDLTGATGVVNMTNANKITSASVGESIQGLVPGVTVRNGGAPGQNSVIEIRGVASFSDATPLYVIDGMIADANSTINTDEIASIQILKDASAAAIYGSRAANGVIIITTRKGRQGPSKITFSAKYGIQQIPKRWDVMDRSEYLQTVQTQYTNSNLPLPSGIAGQVASPTVNTDWQDAIYRTGGSQDYNLGISGGSETGNYLVSGSYYKSQGVLIGNDFQRASLRINTEFKKGRLTVGENVVLSNSNGANPGGGVNAFYEAPQMLPIIPVKDPSYNTIPGNPGGWGLGSGGIPSFANNYVAVNALDKQTYNFAKIVGNAYVDLKLTNWLSYRFNAGVEASFDYHKEIRDTGIWRFENQPAATSIGEDRETFTNYLLEHTLNFNKSFGLHNINGVVGYSYQEEKRQVTSGSRINLTSANGELFTTISSATGIASSAGGTPDFFRIQGFLGRLNYTYNDKYLLTFSGRIDQDSRFGEDFRTGNFYAGAASWRISKEKFFNVSWMPDLKLRASYGQLGISSALESLAGSWPYLGYINTSPRAVYGVSQTPVIGQYQANLSNPDLRWEQRNELNIGFDAGLLENKLLVTADVYNNLSKGVLVNVRLPFYVGNGGNPDNPSIIANAASIRNTGFEASITYKHYASALKWDATINGTSIKNRVVSVGNQAKNNYIEGSTFSRSQIGHPMAAWYMLQTDGIFQSQDEVDNYKNKDGDVIQPNAKPGDIKYVDQNDDGQINNDDRTFVGSPWPTFQGGLQFNASYKQFTLNIQFVGVFGYKIYDDIRRVLDGYQNTNFRKDVSPWTTSNTSTSDPRIGIETGDPGITDNNLATSSRWLENGSYLRLRNIEIGYQFSKSILEKAGFSNSRIFVSGQNLFTITKYKGLDPDVVGAGIQLRGLDNGNWPSSRIFSFGIQGEF